jgi:hypothetical protein
MTWSKTLELAFQKFYKLTATYVQILSLSRQGPDPEKFIFYILCVELYCHQFELIPDEEHSKIKFLGHFWRMS